MSNKIFNYPNLNTINNNPPDPLNQGTGYLMDMKDLPELNYMKHRHDSDNDYVDYRKNILNKSLSSYMFGNETMNGFISRLQGLVSLTFDEINILKNWKNYSVDKYFYKNKQ